RAGRGGGRLRRPVGRPRSRGPGYAPRAGRVGMSERAASQAWPARVMLALALLVGLLTLAARAGPTHGEPGAPAASGAVWSWGWNADGQLGDGTDLAHPAPRAVSGLVGVTALAAGAYHSLALREDGTVWA